MSLIGIGIQYKIGDASFLRHNQEGSIHVSKAQLALTPFSNNQIT